MMDYASRTSCLGYTVPDGPSAIDDRSVGGVKANKQDVLSQGTVGPMTQAICVPNLVLFSQQISEAIRVVNCSPVIRQMSVALRAINSSLAVQQMAEAIRVINSLQTQNPALPVLLFKNPPHVRTCLSLDVNSQLKRQSEVSPTWSTAETAKVVDAGPSAERHYWLTRFDSYVTDDGLRVACRGLFGDGHYSMAVQMACTYIDNIVRDLSGHADKYGAPLMRAAFSPKQPVIQLNKLQNQSDRNQQQGYMDIFAGMMTGIRNPRAHEYALHDTPEEALEILVLANHLLRVLRRSKLV